MTEVLQPGLALHPKDVLGIQEKLGGVTSSSEETLVDDRSTLVERQLGETEVSYYLPSREDGVNDMYLHLGFRTTARLMQHSRVALVWAILRLRHPLLASCIEMRSYSDIKFSYPLPSSPEQALKDASNNLDFRNQNKEELIDAYLNGPRTLSNQRLSYLIVSQATRQQPESGDVQGVLEFDLMICATHYLGDGMALHQFANDFFGLLGGVADHSGLMEMLNSEWSQRYAKGTKLPLALEDRLPVKNSSRFYRAASTVDFQNSQRKVIGGQVFPKRSKRPRHTIVPTVSFDVERSKKILQKCKARGVTISSALFAVCNVAWAKCQSHNKELPMMMYSALNLRPYLTANKSLYDSYWFIAIGYFNVILPAFLPPESGAVESILWHRARSAKKQSTDAAKSPLVVSRSAEMARERGQRARRWAEEDDGVIEIVKPSLNSIMTSSVKVPSNALLGLSLLGNLDGIYKHSEFADIQLHTLTTGSRQRAGGMLLFGYTFAQKLWVSFGYDENGFDQEVIQKFWDNVLAAIDEYLVSR